MDKLTDHKQATGKGFSVRKLFPVLLILMAIAAFFIFGLDEYLTFRALSENRDRLIEFVTANYVAAALLYMGLYVVIVALSLPGGALMTVTGGFLFGWVAAGLMTVFAATIGATLLFLIAATSLGEPLRKKAPAFLGVKLRTYIVGTFFGIIPGTFVFAYLGGGLDSIIREQQSVYQACVDAGRTDCVLDFKITSLVTPEIILSFCALGVIALLPVVIKKLRKQKI